MSDDRRWCDLTILIPARNEADGIERAIMAAKASAARLMAQRDVETYEILVVDDASTDATPEILDGIAPHVPELRVVRNAVQRTLGGSLRAGFDAARGDLVLYTDADLPFDLFELTKAVRILQQYEADIVSLYRHDRTGEGPRRLVYSYLYNLLVHTALGLRIRDVNFAGKLIRREVIEGISLNSEGSFIDVELLSKAERAGFEIVQFGVDYYPRSRGVSTLSSGPVIRKMLAEMIAIVPEIRSAGQRVAPR